MRSLGVRSECGVVALLGGLLLLAGCADDDGNQPVRDGGSETPDGLTGTDAAAGGGGPDASVGGGGGDIDAATDAGPGHGGDGGGQASFARLPKVLSLSGCAELGIPTLCSVTQTEGSFTANCGGTQYTGSVGLDRSVALVAPERTSTAGAKQSLSCTGKLAAAGDLSLDCKQTTAALPDAPAKDQTCKLASDPVVMAGVACLELPSELEQVSVCSEGAAQGGTTLRGGRCQVIQDGCVFQAECENDLTLSGTVTRTGVRFTRALKALADATTPTTGSMKPAFLKGEEVSHTCTGSIAAGTLTGTCTAGAVRGGMPTSVCALAGQGTLPPSCEPVSPAPEQMFVLDACDQLKNGEGSSAGIGEPVCLYRQNGCIWDLQCGQDKLTRFSGRLEPGAKKVSWTLASGTPCELRFDAAGKVSGQCTVSGQAACTLSDMPAVAGAASCPALPPGNNVKSHGCAGGDPLGCRSALQHGCNYMALCGFTANNPDLVIAGKTSVEAGRPHFAFNGLGEYSCSVDKANEAEVASGDRSAYEWYGQCVTPAGGMCRDTYDPVAKTGFRGLRLYWDLPAGSPFPPGPTPVAATP